MRRWPTRDTELIRLWSSNLSTAEIGKAMKLTKYTIIGRAHRLNLPARPSPIRRGGPPVPPKPEQVHPATLLPKLTGEEPLVLPEPSHGGMRIALAPARAATVAPVDDRPPAGMGCQFPTWTHKNSAYWAALAAGDAPVCGKPRRWRCVAGIRVPDVYCEDCAKRAYVVVRPSAPELGRRPSGAQITYGALQASALAHEEAA
jgi:GcrA cell cycle regulator